MKCKIKIILILILVALIILGTYSLCFYHNKYQESIHNQVANLKIYIDRTLKNIDHLEEDISISTYDSNLLKDQMFLIYYSIDNLSDLLNIKEEVFFGNKLINGEMEEDLDHNELKQIRSHLEEELYLLTNLYSEDEELDHKKLKNLLIHGK